MGAKDQRGLCGTLRSSKGDLRRLDVLLPLAGVEHRMGNALHYTQIKKSDLKFEPFAEYLAEEGDWMDITIISDSPLLEHDAMYMLQHYDKARQRLLEIKARDERRAKLAVQQGIDPEELKRKEEEGGRP